jgi:hypothetical protein
MKTLAGLVLAVIGIASLIYGYALHEASQPVPPDSVNLGVALPSATALFETSLQDRITTSDTSMSIVSAAVRGGGTLSGYQCFTVDEGRSDAEFICGTLSGTTVSGLERGIDPLTGTSSVAALKFAHRKGANVKITDFPILSRVRNQNNGVETYPNLLTYTAGTACSVGSANATICDKAYIDGVVVSGASNANETTKGIVEAATQIEMASSSNLGSTGAGLYVQSKNSTSSPYTTGLWNVITMNDGKISPNFIATSSAYTYRWDAFQNFTAATSTSFGILGYFNWNGLGYTINGSRQASSTVLSENGSGGLSWNPISRLQYLNTSPTAISGTTASTTIFSATIPANTINAQSTLRFDIYVNAIATNSSGFTFGFGYGTGTTTINQSASTVNNTFVGIITCIITWISPSSQLQTCSGNLGEGGTSATAAGTANLFATKTSSVDVTQAQFLSFVGKLGSSGGSVAITQVVGTIAR